MHLLKYYKIEKGLKMLIRETRAVGPLQCNCTIVACDETKKGVVIDPGGDAKKILDIARSLGVQLIGILHTHAHFDHLGATKAIFDATQAIRYLHESDMFLYQNVAMQCSMFNILVEEPGGVDKLLEDEQLIEVGNHSCKTLHTPGHTPGSCSFHFEAIQFLASGDTLFREGVGRTDLWGGNTEQMMASIKNKIYTLDPNTKVVPGHGPETTIGYEKRYNPYIRG